MTRKRITRHRVRALYVTLAALCLLGLGASSGVPLQTARAAPARDPLAKFHVQIDPGKVGQLDFVWIRGNTVMDGAARDKVQTVTLTISLPNGRDKVTVRVPAASADGLFRACFNQTNMIGNYGVLVNSPGGGAIGSSSFKVEAGYGPPDEEATLGETAVEFETQIEKLARTVPPSPAREDLQIKLDTLRVRLTDSLKQIQAFNAVLKRLYALFLAYPQERVAFAPVLHALDSWADDADKLETRIAEEMRAATQGSVRCDDVSRIGQDLTDMAELLAMLETPMKVVAAFEKNYKDMSGLGIEDNINCVQTPGSVPQPKSDPAFEAALKGLDPADVPAAYMAATLAIARDTLATASERLFSVYCEQFLGPFSAHMRADLSDHGRVWWSYDIYAEGTLSLRYVKGATAVKEQRVTGEFDGNITHFTVHESALDVLFPKLKGDATYWHNDAVPAVPQHFRLPVSGIITSDQLEIGLDSSAGATDDNENNAAHSSYVLVSPYLLAPIVQTFNLPYKNMAWVVGKALADKSARFTIIVDTGHRKSYVSRTITNARRNPGAVSNYDLRVTACNPSCAAGI